MILAKLRALFGGPKACRVLITGFGPFPGVPDNASQRLVETLFQSREAFFPGITLRAEILPVSWEAAMGKTRQAISSFKPDVVLHFGVSKGASRFRIETRAANVCGGQIDQCGKGRPVADLYQGEPAALSTTLDAAQLLDALQSQGLNAELSTDAGRYLCNAVFYTSLRQGRTSPARKICFIHIPAIGAPGQIAPHLSFEELLAGARCLVRISADNVLTS